MKRVYVVDTNVGIVANNQNQSVSPTCVIACVEALQVVLRSCRLAVDDGNRIVDGSVGRHLLHLTYHICSNCERKKWAAEALANMDLSSRGRGNRGSLLPNACDRCRLKTRFSSEGESYEARRMVNNSSDSADA